MHTRYGAIASCLLAATLSGCFYLAPGSSEHYYQYAVDPEGNLVLLGSEQPIPAGMTKVNPSDVPESIRKPQSQRRPANRQQRTTTPPPTQYRTAPSAPQRFYREDYELHYYLSGKTAPIPLPPQNPYPAAQMPSYNPFSAFNDYDSNYYAPPTGQERFATVPSPSRPPVYAPPARYQGPANFSDSVSVPSIAPETPTYQDYDEGYQAPSYESDNDSEYYYPQMFDIY